MPNEKTNEAYEDMRVKLSAAVEERKRLLAEQSAIDEKLDDIMRVISSVDRALRSLHPAYVKASPPRREPADDPQAIDPAMAAAVEEGIRNVQ